MAFFRILRTTLWLCLGAIFGSFLPWVGSIVLKDTFKDAVKTIAERNDMSSAMYQLLSIAAQNPIAACLLTALLVVASAAIYSAVQAKGTTDAKAHTGGIEPDQRQKKYEQALQSSAAWENRCDEKQKQLDALAARQPAIRALPLHHPRLEDVGRRIESAIYGAHGKTQSGKPKSASVLGRIATLKHGERIPVNHYSLGIEDPAEGEDKFLTVTYSETIRQAGFIESPWDWLNPTAIPSFPQATGPLISVEYGQEPSIKAGQGLIITNHGEPAFNVTVSDISNGSQLATFTESIATLANDSRWVSPHVQSLSPSHTSGSFIDAISEEGDSSPSAFSVSYNRFHDRGLRTVAHYTIVKDYLTEKVTVTFRGVSMEQA